MPRYKEPEPVFDESKRWLDSYADAVTLLLAFFIMMFAFSLVDPKKFTDFKFGVAQALGKPNPMLEGGIGLLDRGNGISSDLALPPVHQRNGDGSEGEFKGTGEISRDQLAQLAAAFEHDLNQAGVAGSVSVDNDPRGLVLHIEDHVLFDSGSAYLKLEGAQVLDTVAPLLAQIDNLIVIEGHTDNVPTNGTRWPTNWELSVARGTNVLRWLVEARGLPSVRMSAAGYADTRPRDSNETSEGRARNRRVEIVIVMDDDTESVTSGNPGAGSDEGDPPPDGTSGAAEDGDVVGLPQDGNVALDTQERTGDEDAD